MAMPMKPPLSVLHVDEFFRIYQIGFVAVWPVLGLSSSHPWTPGAIVALVAISAAFNIVGGVLNDICDIESDRLAPSRAQRWLVTGAVSTRAAAAVVAAQLPLMAVVHVAAGFNLSSLRWLAAAVAGEALYDLFGKKSRVPPVAEAGQALAAFALVCYGATCLGGGLSALAWTTATAAAAMLLLANAFHGGLRDIRDDAGARVRTTPLWFGCGFDAERVRISAAMSAYAASCLTVMMAASLAAAASGSAVVFALTGAETLGVVALFAVLHRLRGTAWEIGLRLHVTLLAIPMITAFSQLLGPARTALVGLIYITPALPLFARRARQGLRARAEPRMWSGPSGPSSSPDLKVRAAM